MLKSSKLFPVAALILLGGCAGKNIHSQLHADPNVLMREWTMRTQTGLLDAGERGTEYSSVVLHEGTLVFGTRTAGLVAIYPSTSQVRWTLPIPHGVVSELTIENGNIFFGGGDGNLYSVNLDNGRVNWQYNLRNPMISRPTVHGGRVFVTSTDDTIYAIDAGTGQWLWHYKRRTAPAATILGASAPLIDGDELLAGLSDGFLVCLSVPDGKLKWERKLHEGRKFTDVDAHPILDDNVLYVPSYDGSLYALNRKGGETIWKYDAGGSKQIVLEEDRIFLPSSDGSIHALQRRSGKLLWKFELDGGVPTQLIVTDQLLIFGSSFQYLYALNKTTGDPVFRFNVGRGSGFTATPAYDPEHRRVFILSGNGNLFAFQVRKPRKHFAHGSMDPFVF